MEFVSIDVTDGVAVLRLDRPKMNAISIQVQSDLREAAAELGDRDDVRSVVIWGGGLPQVCLDLDADRVHLRPVQPQDRDPVGHVDRDELHGGSLSRGTAWWPGLDGAVRGALCRAGTVPPQWLA